MENIILNKTNYTIKDNEARLIEHKSYNNLILRTNIGELERHVGLICDLGEDLQLSSLLIIGWTHGGFLANEIKRRNIYKSIFIESDMKEYPFDLQSSNDMKEEPDLIYIVEDTNEPIIFPNNKIIITSINIKTTQFKYKISNSNLFIYNS